jgi:cell division protein FtsL
MTDEQNLREHQPRKQRGLLKLLVAACLAALGVSLAMYQSRSLRFIYPVPTSLSVFRDLVVETEDGRQLLWATGARDVESGEWFDMTDSSLDPRQQNETAFDLRNQTIGNRKQLDKCFRNVLLSRASESSGI